MIHRLHHARLSVAVISGAAVIGVAGCDALSNPLDVETSSRIPAINVETPANAQLLVDGAVADFECAFGAYVVQSATVGEEFIYAQQLADRLPPDRRAVTSLDSRYSGATCQGLGIYIPLQTARNSAETVLNYLQNVWTDAEVPGRARLTAFAAAYAGYSYVMLGEGFCTMAISRVNPDRSIDYGGEIQRDSVFRLAVARFTTAIAAAQAANNTDMLRMAHVGRARAHLNLGNYAAAKADAQQVPANYVRNATYGDVGRRRNQVFDDNSATGQTSSIGEPYRSMSDTRVPVVSVGQNTTTGIARWYQTKYTSAASPIPLATWEEAQLIIAEADIRAGSLATALPILNASRARGGNTTPFVGVTQADYMAELVNQRRRELFLESHHLADIIRYSIPVTPPAGTPYHFGGGTYGTQICFPLPQTERLNNPAIG